MKEMGLLGMLSICSVEDIRRKEINIWVVSGFAILGLLLNIVEESINIYSIAGGILLGGVLYGYSIISNEKLGKGDAVIIAVISVFIGFWDTLSLLCISSFLAVIIGILLILTKDKTLYDELPFVPFILAGYISVLSLSLVLGDI